MVNGKIELGPDVVELWARTLQQKYCGALEGTELELVRTMSKGILERWEKAAVELSRHNDTDADVEFYTICNSRQEHAYKAIWETLDAVRDVGGKLDTALDEEIADDTEKVAYRV